MVESANHELVRNFFRAVSTGAVPDSILTPDMTLWTTISGPGTSKEKYQRGLTVMRAQFTEGPHFTIDSLTGQDDRVAAEVRAEGLLVDGRRYHNTYVFVFRIEAGRIASVAEHFNPDLMRDLLLPLMQAASAGGSAAG